MGGKTSTSQSTVSVPASVLAQYQSVNATAEQTAQTPFQDYTGQFVAPVNAEQTAGIEATNAAANEAQPYYSAATSTLGSTQAATQPVNTAAEIGTLESGAPITGSDINQYLSPYLGDVLSSTEAIQNQENQQAQAGQLGDAITSGAFGSDRTGIAAANLQQQEDLANASTISNIANTGYQSALTEANTEQQTGLQAANQLASIGQTAYGEGANTASELGTLGTGAQSAALTGAEAQISAGTVQQQTQQAEDTALYNQFEQQQSYPFQVDQFLADIAEGTGSLSGSSTTTTQPGGLFSDRRLKHDIKKIGETFDRQTVYSYKMGDDPKTYIGLMAQEVEKRHPEAVGVAGGFKTVDYGRATKKAANQGHFYTGGVVPFRRIHRDTGGGLAGVLQAQQQMYSRMSQPQQRQINSTTGGGGRSLPVAQAPASTPPSGASELGQTMGLINQGDKLYKNFTSGTPNTGVVPAESTGPVAPSAAAPSSATGVVPSSSMAPAGLQSSGVVTAGAPEATAAPAAASAAAPAAASAAAPAAADTAGTAAAGAAGTAAAGAGAEAGADAAAALAAEYAAADAGMAAAFAARGGRIRRYASGGTPYLEGGTNDSGDLNIPDQPNTNTLQAAPAAGKQPTGFQNMLYMGNPQNAGTITGEVFSNQALAAGGVAGPRRRAFGGPGTEVGDPSCVPYPQVSRGAEMRAPGRHRATGGVAGRRGFDGGGGATDDDDDPTTVPQSMTVPTGDAIVTASGPPSGVASGTSSASPPSTGGGIAGWWGRNKGNVIPLLEGLGAAMTAPTSHPGVAIAAGLEAAARGYTPTQEGLATAQGQQIANRMAALKLGVAQQALAPSGISTGVIPRQAPAPQASPASSQTVNPAPATIAGARASTASPAPAGTTTASPGTPQQPSPSATQTAAGLAAQYRAKFFVNTARTPEEQAQKDAAIKKDWAVGGTMFSQQADTDYQARVQRDQQNNRNAAQQEADVQYAAATDPQATQAARAAALARYNALRQWTGDSTTLDASGIVKNSRTQQPEIGTLAAQGLTAEQAATLRLQGKQVTTDENGNQFIVDRNTGVRVPVGVQSSTDSGATAPPSAGRPSGATVSAPPMLPGFDITKLPRTAQPSGFATVTSQVVPLKTQEFKASELETLPTEIDQAARNSATYSQLQAQLANADPRAFGPSSSTYKAVTGLKTYLTGLPPNGLVNQEEVDKYLSQLGVMGSKQLIGEGQQLRQQELLTLMARANPNIDQPIQVIRNLAAFGQANNDFDLRAGNTIMAALRQGSDPYATVAAVSNQRPAYVQQRMPQVTIVRTGTAKGRKVVQYADGSVAYAP